MYEPRDYELVFAIILLTIVIAILGAPFSWNEYNKLIDREKIIRNFNNVLDRKDPSTELKIITNAVTPVRTIRPPAPAIRITQHKITDGYWCRDTTMNRGKAPTDVKECYQFMSDGTFKWGYSPGYPMGKSISCWSPDATCTYSLNAKSQYEVKGGYFYTLSGDMLVDPHDPPYFRWSSSGIP